MNLRQDKCLYYCVFHAAVSDSLVVAKGTALHTSIACDVPASLVQAWIDDYAAEQKNPGLYLCDSTGGAAGYQALFFSSEYGQGPVLNIELVPEPATMSVLGIGAALALVKKPRK